MDRSTPVEPQTKQHLAMYDQGFVSDETYRTGLDAASQIEYPERSTSVRWHTTNSSNTMELERHLSLGSVTSDVRVIGKSNERYGDSDKPDLTAVMPTQANSLFSKMDSSTTTSDRFPDSRGQTTSSAAMRGYSPSQVLRDSGYHSNLEDIFDGSSEKSQSAKPDLRPSLALDLIHPTASRNPDHRKGTSEQEEQANPLAVAEHGQKYERLRAESSTDRGRGSNERLNPSHPILTSENERRGRSPSPRPKVSAETKARWAMLKQLAGVSQPHGVGEEDQREHLDEKTSTTELDIRVREEASGGESWQTDDHGDDASIERYLQKLQGDPHIDSRGLQEGLSRMHSYKDLNRQDDQDLVHRNHYEDETHSDTRRLSDNTRILGMENAMRREDQDMRNTLHKGEGRVEQALRGHEAALRKDEHALEAGLESASRRSEGKLRAGSRDARGHLQKFKQGLERDARRDLNIADAEMHSLGSQTAREVQRAEHTLEAGLQGGAQAVERSLPHTNVRQDLRRGEQKLMEEVRKTKNATSRTGLGLEVQRGELELIGDVHKLEHELAHSGLGQEIRKSEADLMADIHKVKNELADVGLGQEIRKGERHLVDEFDKLGNELSKLKLGRDLRRGGHDLMHRDEEALSTEAEAIGQSLEHGLERIGKSALEGTETSGGHGMMAHRHVGSDNNASSPRPNLTQSGHAIVKPNNQQIPSKPHQSSAHPLELTGLSSATRDRRPNRNPASDQNGPSIVEPPGHPPIPQTSQTRRPYGSQEPHLSPNPSPARTPSPSPATNKSPGERVQSPGSGDNKKSQAPVRNPVLLPQPQASPQERPPTTVTPRLPPQRPQGASQHPPQNQHSQGAIQRPPQPQHPQDTQPRPPNATSQNSQPSQSQRVTQHQQNTASQHPQLQHAPSAPQQAANAMPQHPQATRSHEDPQQSQASQATHQPTHPQIASRKRPPASATPQYLPPPQPRSVPRERSQIRVPPNTIPPYTRVAPQQTSADSMPPHLQRSPKQGPASSIPHFKPQKPEGIPQQNLPNDRRKWEAQRPGIVPSGNMQQARQARPGATAGSHSAQPQPLLSESLKSEDRVDNEEPRAPLMQQTRRGVAEPQRRMPEGQEQKTENDEDQDGEYSPHQIETQSTSEHAVESRSISGPQSMLNMFKAQADAAIEASGECPSFTGQMIQLLCNMAQDAMPEIERRLAQNQRQGYS